MAKGDININVGGYTPIPRTQEAMAGYGLNKTSLQNFSDEKQQLLQEQSTLLAKKKELEGKLATAYVSPTLTADEQDMLEEQRLRAGAEAYMGYDPNTAYQWLQQAENLKSKRDMAQQKRLDEQDINSIENVKQLAVQYRNARSAYASDTWANLPENERKQVDSEIKGLRTQLQKTELGRALIGSVDSELPAPTNKQTQTVTQTSDNVSSMISMSVDKDNNGQPDNAGEVEKAISLLASELGEGNPDVKAVKAQWEAKKKDIASSMEKGRYEEEKSYSRTQTLFKKMADSGALLNGLSSLKADPQNSANKQNVMTSVLRKESGASIANSEFGRRMSGWLGASDYNKMVNEMTGLGIIIAGKLSTDAMNAQQEQIVNKYLAKVDGNKIYAFAKDLVEPDVLDAYNKRNKGTGTTVQNSIVINGSTFVVGKRYTNRNGQSATLLRIENGKPVWGN